MKIDIKLSTKSVSDAIKQLEQYKVDLEHKTRLLAEKLAEYGVEVARLQIESFDMPFSEGELKDSLSSVFVETVRNKTVFVVRADSDHAAFVEFGTGDKGEEHSAEHLPPGVTWDYNIGETIRETADGRHYWFYPKNGKWYYTEGMPSRPFMYQTWETLYKTYPDIVKQVFKKVR